MAAMSSLPRLSWAVDQLDLRPTHHVLEVGCGHGVAVGPVLDRLTTGRYVGLDRSASMIAASERRNRDAVASGRARFVCGAVDESVDGSAGGAIGDADLGGRRFDRLFGARVAALATPAGLAFAARHLAPGGVLLLVVDSPGGAPARDLLPGISGRLAAAGFEPSGVAEARISGQPVAAVSAVLPGA
jgi:SAM-dependent methyltransferase